MLHTSFIDTGVQVRRFTAGGISFRRSSACERQWHFTITIISPACTDIATTAVKMPVLLGMTTKCTAFVLVSDCDTVLGWSPIVDGAPSRSARFTLKSVPQTSKPAYIGQDIPPAATTITRESDIGRPRNRTAGAPVVCFYATTESLIKMPLS